ncbi:MAG: ATP synthase F1 subunit gamma [Bacteroidota bacterium]
MANLKEIRERIRSVKTTKQMTSAMKMVAAAKLGRAQKNIERLRPYATKLQEIMGDIAGNVSEPLESPYAEERTQEKVMLVVITSNRGLCGAFNANVAKEGVAAANGDYQDQYAAGNLGILAIGKKGFEFFERREFNMVGGKNHDVFADLRFETVNAVAQSIMDAFVEGEWDRVELVYNTFKNAATQVLTREQFLPLRGVEEHPEEAEASGVAADYIFEPDQYEILSELIPKSLRIQLYRAILESNAGEQGARMVAMDNATENAEELLKSLRLSYNKARQAAITTEILEIVAGAEALESA